MLVLLYILRLGRRGESLRRDDESSDGLFVAFAQ